MLPALVLACASALVRKSAPFGAHGNLGIVNGDVVPKAQALAEFGFMSFQASADEGGAFCGGALIAPEWVLTAAHCLYSSQASELKVTVDVRRYDYTKSAASEGGFEARLSAYYAHPQYNAQKVTNDVALLRLAAPVPAATATPIELDQGGSGAAAAGANVTVVGWGSQDVACKDYSETALRRADIQVPTDAACASAEGKTFDETKQICAGRREPRKQQWVETGCGDSGSPLLARLPATASSTTEADATAAGKWVATGIVSWGFGSTYDVYTRVSAYTGWIEACMANETACTAGTGQGDDDEA